LVFAVEFVLVDEPLPLEPDRALLPFELERVLLPLDEEPDLEPDRERADAEPERAELLDPLVWDPLACERPRLVARRD